MLSDTLHSLSALVIIAPAVLGYRIYEFFSNRGALFGYPLVGEYPVEALVDFSPAPTRTAVVNIGIVDHDVDTFANGMCGVDDMSVVGSVACYL
jgi:hypothetical protein